MNLTGACWVLWTVAKTSHGAIFACVSPCSLSTYRVQNHEEHSSFTRLRHYAAKSTDRRVEEIGGVSDR